MLRQRQLHSQLWLYSSVSGSERMQVSYAFQYLFSAEINGLY
jgi:hypothetical protein